MSDLDTVILDSSSSETSVCSICDDTWLYWKCLCCFWLFSDRQ